MPNSTQESLSIDAGEGVSSLVVITVSSLPAYVSGLALEQTLWPVAELVALGLMA